MTQDSTDAARARALQDRWIEGRVDEVRTAYEGGDQSKLLDLVFLCATYQAVIPDWAVDALLGIRDELNEGRLRDLNEAFAWNHSDIRTRAAGHRREQLEQAILAALMRHRISRSGSRMNPKLPRGNELPDIKPDAAAKAGAGGNFRAADGLQEIADHFGFRRRDVEAVLKKHSDALRDIPKGGGGVGRSVMNATMPPLVARRRGRAMLRDD